MKIKTLIIPQPLVTEILGEIIANLRDDNVANDDLDDAIVQAILIARLRRAGKTGEAEDTDFAK